MTEQERQDRVRRLNRERNARYLAKLTLEQQSARAKASARYVERLASDPALAEKRDARKAAAVIRTSQWQTKFPEKTKANAKAYRQRHSHKEVAKVQARNAAKLRATPSWADKAAITRFYENARYLTEVTGVRHHVDHIVPLRSPIVCGLHVQSNLRAVPFYLNLRKSNKLEI